MKKTKLFKGALAILTSLALVLSTQTTAWATTPFNGYVGDRAIEGSCQVSGQDCYAYTKSVTGDPSIRLTVLATATCRNRQTNQTHYENLASRTSYKYVSTSATVDSKYAILILTAYHYAEMAGYKDCSGSSIAP